MSGEECVIIYVGHCLVEDTWFILSSTTKNLCPNLTFWPGQICGLNSITFDTTTISCLRASQSNHLTCINRSHHWPSHC